MRPELDSSENHHSHNEVNEYDHAVSFADAMIKKVKKDGRHFLDMFNQEHAKAAWKMAYAFFADRVEMFYDDPEWSEFRQAWDKRNGEK